MKFKNIGVITSIKQSLNKKKEITIKLDNYLDDEKYNVIYLCDPKLGTVNSKILQGTQFLVKDDFPFDVISFDVQKNKKYEFEFEIVKNSTGEKEKNIDSLDSKKIKDLKGKSTSYTLTIKSITE